VEVAVDDTPVGEYDPGAQQDIAGQPVEPAQEAESAAEGEAGDPDRGATAGRHGAAGSVQPVVDLGQACACADPRAPVRADGDGFEAAQVEDQTRCR